MSSMGMSRGVSLDVRELMVSWFAVRNSRPSVSRRE